MIRLLEQVLAPSRTALAGVAVVFLAWWVVVLVAVRPETLRGLDERWFLVDRDDDYGRLTHQVLRLETHVWGPDSVLYLGPSSAREVLTDPDDLGRRLALRLGRPVDVFGLAADAETPIEYAAILDAMPDGFAGVVVLGVSPSMMARSHTARLDRARGRDELQLGWISAERDDALRAIGVAVDPPTGIYAFDARRFLLPRAFVPLRVLAGRRVAHRWHRTKEDPKPDLAESRRVTRAKLAHYEDGVEGALATLDGAMSRFRARSASVSWLLLEQPAYPGELRELFGAARYDGYTARIRKLARQRDASYVDLDEHLEASDFADLVHVASPEGRRRFTVALVTRLRGLL